MATALSIVAAIGWLDAVTGPDVGFSLFYLVPIVTCAWLLGHRAAVAVAVASAIVWFLADHAARPGDVLSVSLWNSFTRLLIYGGAGWLPATVRADRRRLMMANTRLRELADQETEVARTDPLTGLPNWRGLTAHLERDMERARRTGEPLAILYIDLDGFKAVNDRHGHAAGDALLRDTGRVLRDEVRASDVAARVGGDEFIVVMPDADADAAGRAGHRMVGAIAKLGERHPEAPIGASVGVACFTAMPSTVDALVGPADRAMYEAKRAGKGQVMITR
jgi:diguanylate cyclase (GGDEF)-like protein